VGEEGKEETRPGWPQKEARGTGLRKNRCGTSFARLNSGKKETRNSWKTKSRTMTLPAEIKGGERGRGEWEP